MSVLTAEMAFYDLDVGQFSEQLFVANTAVNLDVLAYQVSVLSKVPGSVRVVFEVQPTQDATSIPSVRRNCVVSRWFESQPFFSVRPAFPGGKAWIEQAPLNLCEYFVVCLINI